jgi:hypothetical protein
MIDSGRTNTQTFKIDSSMTLMVPNTIWWCLSSANPKLVRFAALFRYVFLGRDVFPSAALIGLTFVAFSKSTGIVLINTEILMIQFTEELDLFAVPVGNSDPSWPDCMGPISICNCGKTSCNQFGLFCSACAQFPQLEIAELGPCDSSTVASMSLSLQTTSAVGDHQIYYNSTGMSEGFYWKPSIDVFDGFYANEPDSETERSAASLADDSSISSPPSPTGQIQEDASKVRKGRTVSSLLNLSARIRRTLEPNTSRIIRKRIKMGKFTVETPQFHSSHFPERSMQWSFVQEHPDL